MDLELTRYRRSELIEAGTDYLLKRSGFPLGAAAHPLVEQFEQSGVGVKHLAHALAVHNNLSTGRSGTERGFDTVLALGGMTTSDFGAMITNTLKAVFLRGFGFSDDHRALVATIPLPNFKPFDTPDLGTLTVDEIMKPIPESGELAAPFMVTSGNGQTLQVRSWGRRLLISRQALINDNFEAVATLLSKIGAVLGRAEKTLLFGTLIANPTLGSGQVFATGHGNAITAADPFNVAGLGAGIAALKLQADAPGNDPAELQPAAVLVHPNNETAIRNALWQTGNTLAVHTFAKVDTGDAYYFADPRIAPVLGLGVLGDGKPRVEPSRPSPDQDAISQLVGHDFGAAVLSWFGVVRVRKA